MFNRRVYRSNAELCNYYLDSLDENTECFLIRPSQLTYYPNISVDNWIGKISPKTCGSWFIEQWIPEIIFLYQTILYDLEYNPSRFQDAYIGHDIHQASEMINHLISTARPWTDKDIFAIYGVEYTPNIFEFLSGIWEKKKEKYRLRCNRAIDHLSQFI